MTAPLPPDITELLADLLDPLPDPAHDLLRAKVLAAMQSVWNYHTQLLDDLTSTQGDLATAQQQIADQQTALDDLTTRVSALENPIPAP